MAARQGSVPPEAAAKKDNAEAGAEQTEEDAAKGPQVDVVMRPPVPASEGAAENVEEAAPSANP